MTAPASPAPEARSPYWVLACSGGHPVWSITEDDAVAALLDPESALPDLDESCLFCGPNGRARAAAGGAGASA